MAPNWFADFALVIGWPAVAILLYATLPPGRATIWTILGGQLLLPSNYWIKYAMIPPIDKNTIPTLAAILGCTLFHGRPLLWRQFRVTEIFALVYVLSPILTSALNGDPIVVGDQVVTAVVPGVGVYDGISASLIEMLRFFGPFMLGRHLLRSATSTEDVLRSLALAGLVYSLPMLLEVRISPQLHYWVYGFNAHSFGQEIRQGGYRPTVFMIHGLVVAFFSATTVIAAAALWRSQVKILRLPPGFLAIYLATVLFLCKSVGALIYGIFLVPLARFASPRVQMHVAVVLVSFALFYPTFRAADLVPTEAALSLADSISPERAQSLQTRFDQEKTLLEHAQERIILGWGRFGRNRLVDPQTGRDESITDGLWILTMGTFGYVGFLAQFGLLALSVWRASIALKWIRDPIQRNYFATLALIVAISVIDQLPNATISPWTWVVVGALIGRAEDARVSQSAPARQPRRQLLFSPSRHSTATSR
jgi:hypothetical protein